MRKVGLNGKSVMPMISGFACAVPAIMGARNIENKKERLLTILITPLMSCSARLPGLYHPDRIGNSKKILLGFFNLQGLVMMGLYLWDLLWHWLFHISASGLSESKEKSFFILELPVYRAPRWKNILLTMVNKAKIFVFDAGKVIMVISLILWALSSYGPSDRMEAVKEKYAAQIAAKPELQNELEKQKGTELLQNSYAGIMGKAH